MLRRCLRVGGDGGLVVGGVDLLSGRGSFDLLGGGGGGLAMLRDDTAEADAGFLVPYLLPADNKRHLQGALLLQDLERRGQSGSLW
jgi:hypothetical protein